jgi:CRP-like cAMP-binding protein
VNRSADGGELTLTVIQAGGLFGELSVADNGPRSTDAEKPEECQLLLIPRERIQDLCARVPSVAQALTSSIAATLRRLTDEAGGLVFLDLLRRVAKVLLSQPKGTDGLIRLRMSQEELAHQVGGTRQSVNAALRFRAARMARGARPSRHGKAGRGAGPVRRVPSVGYLTGHVSARRLTSPGRTAIVVHTGKRNQIRRANP